MANWFECKVSYKKAMENGVEKKVTDTYLVDALTFTEAESRFLEEVASFIGGDYEVTGIKRARLADVFESIDSADDYWYRSRIAFITIDEKTGVEKRACQNVLIQAKDFATAVAYLQKEMAGTLGEWLIVNMAETPILDVYRYEAKSDKPEFQA